MTTRKEEGWRKRANRRRGRSNLIFDLGTAQEQPQILPLRVRMTAAVVVRVCNRLPGSDELNNISRLTSISSHLEASHPALLPHAAARRSRPARLHSSA